MADDPTSETYQAANRAWWDAAVPIHVASRGYDREGFLRGGRSLSPVEVAELGPHVSGKSLLHLQCHFGMDSLDWARLGAEVTGLDLSEVPVPASVAPARAAARLGSAHGIGPRHPGWTLSDTKERRYR